TLPVRAYKPLGGASGALAVRRPRPTGLRERLRIHTLSSESSPDCSATAHVGIRLASGAIRCALLPALPDHGPLPAADLRRVRRFAPVRRLTAPRHNVMAALWC